MDALGTRLGRPDVAASAGLPLAKVADQPSTADHAISTANRKQLECVEHSPAPAPLLPPLCVLPFSSLPASLTISLRYVEHSPLLNHDGATAWVTTSGIMDALGARLGRPAVTPNYWREQLQAERLAVQMEQAARVRAYASRSALRAWCRRSREAETARRLEGLALSAGRQHAVLWAVRVWQARSAGAREARRHGLLRGWRIFSGVVVAEAAAAVAAAASRRVEEAAAARVRRLRLLRATLTWAAWAAMMATEEALVRRREAAALKLQCFRRGNGGRAAARAARQMSQTASLAAAELASRRSAAAVRIQAAGRGRRDRLEGLTLSQRRLSAVTAQSRGSG